MADEKKGYTMSDRAAYFAFKGGKKIDLPGGAETDRCTTLTNFPED